MSYLHSVFEHAIDRGWTAENPVRRAARPKRRRAGDVNPDVQFLTLDELEAVIRTIPDGVVVREPAPTRRNRPGPAPPPPPDVLGPVLRVLIRTAAMTGLRRSELLGLRCRDDRVQALVDVASELASMDEPRKQLAGISSGLDIHHDLGEGHPLLGRRMPDLELTAADGALRVFELLHDARPQLLELGRPGDLGITPWADRVRSIDASYNGEWELPVLGVVSAPTAVLIRPDGYVAWVGEGTHVGLVDALATWFGPPTVT